MSAPTIAYLAGLALAYIAERLLGGFETLRWVFWAGSIACLAAAIGLHFDRFRKLDDPGSAQAAKWLAILSAAGTSSLLFYVFSTAWTAELLALGATATERWQGVWAVMWPIVLVLASLPLLIVDHTAQRAPVILPPRRLEQALQNGLAAALAVVLVFPVNYLANRHDEQWNLSYFRTAEPGSSTRAIVAALDKPVDVHVFQPASSDVLDEILNYLRPLEGPNFRVHVRDQAAEPALSRKLRVPDNGYVALTQEDPVADAKAEDKGEDDNKAAAKRKPAKPLKIGTELNKARPILKKLDEEMRKQLFPIVRGELKAYFTTGHGELTWKDGTPMTRLSGLHKVFTWMNFEVATLGLADGLGSAVPEDANIVVIAGPSQPFLPEEITALKAYADRGGAIFVALEPNMGQFDTALGDANTSLAPLLNHLGVKLGKGMLADDQGTVVLRNNKSDRANVTTKSFSVHDTTSVMSKMQLGLFTPTSGHLKKMTPTQAKVTFTVRSRSTGWADLDGDLEYDKTKESKRPRNIASASTGGGEKQWRALVVADASVIADFPLSNLGNQQFVYDGVNWLVGTEDFAGTVPDEEDVKIQHSKEGQAIWFYGTVIGVPLLILIGGAFRVRTRRKGGRR